MMTRNDMAAKLRDRQQDFVKKGLEQLRETAAKQTTQRTEGNDGNNDK